MTELARGSVADRPWGRTLGALGLRGLSGQLTLVCDGKSYRVAFDHGAVVGASSPLATDAAVRLALTGGLVTSTQVADITRRIAARPGVDDVDVIAEAARLQPEHAQKLRRRLVAQRAARTFSVDHGEFVVDDGIDLPVAPGSELDVRAVIYLGAHSNLAEERLAGELEQLGGWFKLLPDAVADLAQFGFTETDKPILQKLVAGANLLDLERGAPDGVGVRGVRAIVYALASYNACEIEAQPRPTIGRTTRETFERPARGTNAPIERRTPSAGYPVPARTTSVDRRTPSAGYPVAQPRTTSVDRRTPSAGYPVPARTSSVELPDGMQLRTPRTSTPPQNTRASSPTAPPATRTPTPSTLPPVTARTPTPGTVPPKTRTTTGPTVSRTATPTAAPVTTRAPTPPATTRTPTPTGPYQGRAPTDPTVARAPTPTGPVDRAPTTPEISRTMTPNLAPAFSRTQSGSPLTMPGRAPSPGGPRVKRNTAAAQETEALIRDRLALLDRGADHFVLLGITHEASPDVTRAAYFTLARKLHPDRLASLGIADAQRDAQRLFAQINNAFAVLNDPVKRSEYAQILGRGGESAVRAEEAKADELAMRVMHAEEAFRRGEMALRREQLEQALVEFTTAAELQPTESEYQAMLTWTRFAAATDKPAIAQETRYKLSRAAEQNDMSPTARFYLGRVERILGREREALSHFQEVLRIKPNHAEASSEIRVLESRMKKR